MTPQSYDEATCREYVGDARAKEIEARARADADLEEYRPQKVTDGSYAERLAQTMEQYVYLYQYRKRIQRNERKSA